MQGSLSLCKRLASLRPLADGCLRLCLCENARGSRMDHSSPCAFEPCRSAASRAHAAPAGEGGHTDASSPRQTKKKRQMRNARRPKGAPDNRSQICSNLVSSRCSPSFISAPRHASPPECARAAQAAVGSRAKPALRVSVPRARLPLQRVPAPASPAEPRPSHALQRAPLVPRLRRIKSMIYGKNGV